MNNIESLVLEGVDWRVSNKAKKLKMIISDVDGVLTNGDIIYSEDGKELKHFNVKDGQVVSYLQSCGVKVGVITGRNSDLVKRRCKELSFDFHYHGIKDKKEVYQKILAKYTCKPEEVAYLGDDVIDLALIKASGLGVAPADAPIYIRQYADIVLKEKGGQGAFRAFCDIVLAAKGKLSAWVNKELDGNV